MKNKINLISKEDRAYIAGILDADGSIIAQIVRRNDYTLKFQVKCSLNVTQKSSRSWFLKFLQAKIGLGNITDRKDGCHELYIIQHDRLKIVLEALAPYLVIKNRTARLVLHIIASLSKDQPVDSFIRICELCDKVALLNDSKRQTITSGTVKGVLLPSSISSP